MDGVDLRPWQDVPRDGSVPFVHRFQTRRHKYLFDVNTRRILRVSPVVWDVTEDYGRLNDQQIIARHASAHGAAEVGAALGHIASARQEQGLLLSFRPEAVVPPSKETIRERLDGRREQLILNATEDCNMRCSYCVFGGQYRYHRTHSAKAMTWGVARPALEDFLSHARLAESRVISFYGGEPLLNLPLIRQCVAHVRENYGGLPVRFSLTTNGYLLRGEAAGFLAAEDFLIVVSLDGPSEVHDRHRRTRSGAPTWALVMTNLREFLAAHPRYRTNGQIRFNAVATRSTDLREVQSFFGSCDLFCDAMGLEVGDQKQMPEAPDLPLPDDPLAVSLNALREQFTACLKAETVQAEQGSRSRWVQGSVFEKPLVAFHKRGFLSPRLPDPVRLLNTCVPGARRTFVNASGEYFACERVVESPEGVIGNVRGGVDLDRVMALLGCWTEASRDQCRYCWCLSTCNIGCFATVGDDGRVTSEAKQEACASCRHNTHQLLVEYCTILEENPKAFDYAADMVLL